MESEKIASSLKQIKDSIDSSTRDELYARTSMISSIIDRFYTKGSAYHSDYSFIRSNLTKLVSGNSDTQSWGPNYAKMKILTHQLIDTLLNEINQLGLPSKKDNTMDKSININNTVTQKQEQSQTQTTTMNLVLETLKDSLTGRQYKEIVEIAETEKDPEQAKPKILQKLLSFGGDVCTNVLANLVTSPQIWTGIVG
jgi:hypothetical protein